MGRVPDELRRTRGVGQRRGLTGRLLGLALGSACLMLVGLTLAGWPLLGGAPRPGAPPEDAARLVGQVLERRVNAAADILATFAASPDFDAERLDLATLDGFARRVAALLGGRIIVTDPQLGQMVNSAETFGAPLPAVENLQPLLQALVDHGPALGHQAGAPAETALTLALPVMRQGRVVALVAAKLPAAILAEAIEAMPWPADRPLVLRDGDGVPVVSLGPAEGSAPRPLAGMPWQSDLAPGWSIAAGEAGPSPKSALPFRLLAGVGLALLLALLTALLLARRLRRWLRAFRQQVEAVPAWGGAEAPVPLPPAPVAELAELQGSVAAAMAARRAMEQRHLFLAGAGPAASWQADPEGRLIQSQGWSDLTGQPAEAARGDGWLAVLHPEDREGVEAAWEGHLKVQAPGSMECRLRHQGDDWHWVRITAVPAFDATGLLTGWNCRVFDIHAARGALAELQRHEARTRQALDRLRAIQDAVPLGLALLDRELRFLSVNPFFAATGGLPQQAHAQRRPAEVLPPALAEPLEEACRSVLATGDPVLERNITGDAAGVLKHSRHWILSCHPVTDADDRHTGVSVVLQDVTEKVRAECARELLMREMNHRVKNTLATAHSLAAQTLRASEGRPDRFGPAFIERLKALARAHDLLTAHAWHNSDFEDTVRSALSPWLLAAQNILIEGQHGLSLRPRQAQAIVLALHELATNAAKHGALSRPEGMVRVAWCLAPDGMTVLDWTESGGPPVTEPAPDAKGFGTRLLEKALKHDLGEGAMVTLDFRREGLRAEIRLRASCPDPDAAQATDGDAAAAQEGDEALPARVHAGT